MMRSGRVIPLFCLVGALGVAAALVAPTRVMPTAVGASVAAAPAAVNLPPLDFAPVKRFLDAHCIECHGEKLQKGDVTLNNYPNEASVLKDREVFEDVLEKLRAGEMPPKKKPRPAKADLDQFMRTVEGMFYRHDLLQPMDPGRVTIRRLNRTEYNNTIRDLVGVDFQPAEDFPSDDIGHGFDNIGEVLTVSPVLVERYLSAAEAVMDRAIPSVPLPPTKHRIASRNLEPALSERQLPLKEVRLLKVGRSVKTTYAVPDSGQYIIRVRVYPDVSADGGDPAKAALLVDGKRIKTFDVVKGRRKSPLIVERPVELKEGEHEFGIELISGRNGDADWGLRVLNMEIQGPPNAKTDAQRALLKCDANLSEQEKTVQILRRFANRAYRRPAAPEEVHRLVDFAEAAQARGETWESSLQLAMQAVLVSPKFLFRVELDDRPDAPGPHPIDEYQLASRLSYFIWSSMPDDELFDLASKKQLSANLESQVRRMLADPRSAALVDNFGMQWLTLRRLKNFSPDNEKFANFDERLRGSMLTETRMFLTAIIHEDRSILDLVDSDFTFLNERLATFYGIGDTNGNPAWGKPVTTPGERIRGDEFVRVRLADHVRGGVLTEASVLCVTSNPSRTSPVKRGKFVLDEILGVPPPPPPPNVPELKADAQSASTASLRQRMEEHRANPICASCHEHMDGIGFAFENFNAIGQYRWKDGNFDIDPSGTMPDGTSFRGIVQLKAMLRQKSDMFSRCLTKKMMTYALGRGVEYYDQRSVDKIIAALKKNDYKFSTLVVEIAKSDPFRQRRGKEQNP